MVVNNAGDLESAEAASHGQLFVERQVDTAGGTTTVRSSLLKLRQQAQAKRFARSGRQAAADAHCGMMSGSGFYASWGVNMLNLLAGSYNQKGGMAHGGGKYNGMGNGRLPVLHQSHDRSNGKPALRPGGPDRDD